MVSDKNAGDARRLFLHFVFIITIEIWIFLLTMVNENILFYN